MKEHPKKFVPDTSVIVEGIISEKLEREEIKSAMVIIPEPAVAELEAQASRGQETGFTGLDELKRLRKYAQQGVISLVYKGRRPHPREIQGASSGEIDALIRDLADKEEATLITSDRIQALVAEGKGINVELHRGEEEEFNFESLGLMQYFEQDTMSVHLRANTLPRAKKGVPGEMNIVSLSDKKSKVNELERYVQEIVEAADMHQDGFIEMDSGGSTVVQLGNVRIAVAKPPFSDAVEITAARPVTKTILDDYSYSSLLKQRMQEFHRGVLVSGAPGMGKSTLVQAVAEFLQKSDWIVKTMEKPRDLDVSPEITQFTALNGRMANTADVLLLSRPDYTVFDEMRTTDDFQVFADMRMAGIGLVGVVHATKGIDALQRLIGRVELGMIPQIVDTVVYVKDGDVQQVYEINFTVKVPTGIEERDLARPVIEVREFETKELQFEIYTFGEQVVVMPVGKEEVKPVWELARREIQYELSGEFNFGFDVQVTSDNMAIVYVADRNVPIILGREGRRIDELERKLGINIDVRTFESMDLDKQEIDIDISDERVSLSFPTSYQGREVELQADGERIFVGAVSKQGDISLRRGSSAAEKIKRAHKQGKGILAQILD